MTKATMAQLLQINNMLGAGAIDRELAQALIEGKVEIVKGVKAKPASNSYMVTVDYARLSLDELNVKYDGGISALFDGRPWERHASTKDIDETPGEREFVLAEVPKKFLGKRIDQSFDALADLFAKDGLRFAVETELDAFGTANPDLQREHYILALGSSALYDDGDRGVACLYGNDDGRWLSRYWVDDGFHGGDRLLLVRK
jgi:hypothetical protein